MSSNEFIININAKRWKRKCMKTEETYDDVLKKHFDKIYVNLNEEEKLSVILYSAFYQSSVYMKSVEIDYIKLFHAHFYKKYRVLIEGIF